MHVVFSSTRWAHAHLARCCHWLRRVDAFVLRRFWRLWVPQRIVVAGVVLDLSSTSTRSGTDERRKHIDVLCASCSPPLLVRRTAIYMTRCLALPRHTTTPPHPHTHTRTTTPPHHHHHHHHHTTPPHHHHHHTTPPHHHTTTPPHHHTTEGLKGVRGSESAHLISLSRVSVQERGKIFKLGFQVSSGTALPDAQPDDGASWSTRSGSG